MINNKLFRAICAATALLFAFAVSSPATAAGIVHRVSVGSPDACEAFGGSPGCDANNSLIAVMFDDGTVTGRFIDWSYGATGILGEVRCLIVDGNEAWISGVAWYFDHGRLEEFIFDVRVVDNGKSANDPPDQISTTHFRGRTCDDIYENSPYDRRVFDLPQGQITVK